MKKFVSLCVFLTIFVLTLLSAEANFTTGYKFEDNEIKALYNSFKDMEVKDSQVFISLMQQAIKLAKKKRSIKDEFVITYLLASNDTLKINPSLKKKYSEEVVNLYNSNQEILDNTDNRAFIGYIYIYLNNYNKAYEYLLSAFKEYETAGIQDDFYARIVSNTAYMARILGDYENAITISNKAVEYAKKSKNENNLSYELNNLGNIYLNQQEYDKALECYTKALELKLKNGEKKRLGGAYNNIATIFYYKGDLRSALENFKKAVVNMKEADFDKEALVTGYMNLCQVYGELNQLDKAVYYGKLAIKTAQENNLPTNESWSVNTLQEAYARHNKYKEAYKLAVRYQTLKDSLFQDDLAGSIAKLKTEYELFQIEKEKQIQGLMIKRQHIVILVIFFLVLALIVIIYMIFRNSMIQKRNLLALEKEQEHSEQLLSNILPPEVILEIRAKGKSTPRLFHEVAVLNIDIVGFTELADTSETTGLFEEINEVFTICDDICEKYSCRRIKTSGDSYLAVAGMFIQDKEYKDRILSAAVQMLEEMKKRFPELRFRAGISCGKIIGAIVGKKNFIYDIFGSTVNTTFRLQSTAEPGTIIIDETLKQGIEHKFSVTESNEIVIKGKSYLTWKVRLDRISM